MATYNVKLNQLAYTVEGANKLAAISSVVCVLGFKPMCIMPLVDYVHDMADSEAHETYYAYLSKGVLYVECKEVTE